MNRNPFIGLLIYLTVNLHLNAAVLDIDTNGFLHGATDIEVNGVLYDVRFLQGSYNELLASGFALDTESAVAAAAFSAALLRQVFVDGPQGEFDSNPRLTYGCSNANVRTCRMETPYAYDPYRQGTVFAFAAENSYLTGSDELPIWADGLNATYRVGDTINSHDEYQIGYVDWSPSALQAVPIPSSISLLGAGLLGLTGLGRAHSRKRLKA